jgi:hypothetical protein
VNLLYYWRGDNYRRDLDWGAGYHLNQSNPILHQIDRGESIWAFTRRTDGVYVLAAELVVEAKTRNPAKFRYGPYRVWGNLCWSRYFQVDDQPTIEGLIRSLSCRATGTPLGRSFQGHAAVRVLTESDHKLLAAFSTTLPLEPRARILPEDELEAAVWTGDPDTVKQLVAREDPGIAAARRRYLYETVAKRNRRLVEELRTLYDGVCQITGWNPRRVFGVDLCEAHHVHWLSRGGEDLLSNLILICPNIHSAIHTCDAQLDWSDGTFVFGQTRHSISLNRHLRLLFR